MSRSVQDLIETIKKNQEKCNNRKCVHVFDVEYGIIFKNSLFNIYFNLGIFSR